MAALLHLSFYPTNLVFKQNLNKGHWEGVFHKICDRLFIGEFSGVFSENLYKIGVVTEILGKTILENFNKNFFFRKLSVNFRNIINYLHFIGHLLTKRIITFHEILGSYFKTSSLIFHVMAIAAAIVNRRQGSCYWILSPMFSSKDRHCEVPA